TITGLLMMIPVRRRIGLLPYAQATRALYKGQGVRVYAAVTILGVLLTVVVTVIAFMQGKPVALTSTATISCVASSMGLVGTARNFPIMQKLWVTTDDDETRVASLLAIWERWHIVGAGSHVAAFIALVVALAYA
ncbi:MAG TPA: hypothetical protein VN327_07380, partial [Pseudonocardiaceae bacterium]|nr:hypothetical protein [Pseudonocardiaceae bacterium]